MKEKCPFYRGVCDSPNECVFIVWHHNKKECRKGGLLKTPKRLKYLEQKMKEKNNVKCIECGKEYFSKEGGFHKEKNSEFYHTICSEECAKKQDMRDEEIALEKEKNDEKAWDNYEPKRS